MTGPTLYGDPIDPNEPISEFDAFPPNYGWYAPPAGPPQPGYLEPSDERPVAALFAAILSVLTAGLLLITGFVVIFAASSLDSGEELESPQRTALFVFAGLLNVVAAALLIVGGVLMLGRSAGSRAMIAAGTLLCIGLGVFWLVNDGGDNGIVVWLIVFCGPVITATFLTATSRVAAWLQDEPHPTSAAA